MAQKCPKCDLLNPPSAERCDCGYDFVTKSMQTSYLAPAEQIRQSKDPRTNPALTLGHKSRLVAFLLGAVTTAVVLFATYLRRDSFVTTHNSFFGAEIVIFVAGIVSIAVILIGGALIATKLSRVGGQALVAAGMGGSLVAWVAFILWMPRR